VAEDWGVRKMEGEKEWYRDHQFKAETLPKLNKVLEVGYFCTKPRKGILRIDKYIISNIFKLFRGSWLFFVHKTITKTK
jgi:hypothetical protein